MMRIKWSSRSRGGYQPARGCWSFLLGRHGRFIEGCKRVVEAGHWGMRGVNTSPAGIEYSPVKRVESRWACLKQPRAFVMHVWAL